MAKQAGGTGEHARGPKAARKGRRSNGSGRRDQKQQDASAAARQPTQFSFPLEFRQGANRSDDLIVVFSTSGRFMLYSHDFGCDTLFVADPLRRYYLRHAPKLAGKILKTVAQGKYRRVLFFGTSKGGFGALSIARICARRKRGRIFHVLALSPQTSLYPRNDRLTFGSYKDLLEIAAEKPAMGKFLRKFGDVTDIGRMPNVVVEIVYACDSASDRDEALAVQGRNVTHHVVRGVTHSTTFYFVSHGLSRENLRARIDRTYSKSEDSDLMQSKPADVGAMIDDILAAAQSEPTLNELMSDVLARKPKRPAALASRDGLAFALMQCLTYIQGLKFGRGRRLKS